MTRQLPLEFHFNNTQTFDSFYPGTNQQIINQLKESAFGNGEQFIYLWADKGHGKSHLLQACCQAAFTNGKSSFYIDLSQSTTFKPEIFVGLDGYEYVCLDNIDLLPSQADWELAVFNFYNQHRDNSGKLITSASCAPANLNFSLPDLHTRLSWGLALKIETLNDDDKVAALCCKAQQLGFNFAPQAARFLISRYDRNLTSMWLMLDKLDFATLAAKRKLTLPFLKEILGNPEKEQF